MEYWNVGILERQNNGIMDKWNDGQKNKMPNPIAPLFHSFIFLFFPSFHYSIIPILCNIDIPHGALPEGRAHGLLSEQPGRKNRSGLRSPGFPIPRSPDTSRTWP